MLNQTIINKIVSNLATWQEDFSKIMWIAFDGTKNMSGHKTGSLLRLSMCIVVATYFNWPLYMLV